MSGRPTFRRSSSEFLSDTLTSPINLLSCPLSQLTVAESYDLVSGSSSNESYNSPSSLLSCCTQKQIFMQRSISLQNIGLHCHFTGSDSGGVRRAFSTGDLEQGQKSGGRGSASPLWNESNATASAIIEGMSRTYRYSPEEKKQRIERYRSKRNLRNFTKKIKYTCRKTLADSRPRIRGRFARNDETEKNVAQVEWSHEEDENWIVFLDSLSANLIIP